MGVITSTILAGTALLSGVAQGVAQHKQAGDARDDASRRNLQAQLDKQRLQEIEATTLPQDEKLDLSDTITFNDTTHTGSVNDFVVQKDTGLGYGADNRGIKGTV